MRYHIREPCTKGNCAKGRRFVRSPVSFRPIIPDFEEHAVQVANRASQSSLQPIRVTSTLYPHAPSPIGNRFHHEARSASGTSNARSPNQPPTTQHPNKLQTSLPLTPLISSALAIGFRTIGSSGCAAQMVFIPPNTTTAIFLDNYHLNFGGPGVDLQTGAHSRTSYLYPGTAESVFGTEFDLQTKALRPLRPLSNTFCSAGAFYKDGTLVNLAGAEAQAGAGVQEGFNKLRTYAPGPCEGDCAQDWSEQSARLQRWRWYPSAQTLVDGSVLVVGGSRAGGLVVNQASVNEPTYEILHQDNRRPQPPVSLPVLRFGEAMDDVPGRSWNLYPICELFLPWSLSLAVPTSRDRAAHFKGESGALIHVGGSAPPP